MRIDIYHSQLGTYNVENNRRKRFGVYICSLKHGRYKSNLKHASYRKQLDEIFIDLLANNLTIDFCVWFVPEKLG